MPEWGMFVKKGQGHPVVIYSIHSSKLIIVCFTKVFFIFATELSLCYASGGSDQDSPRTSVWGVLLEYIVLVFTREIIISVYSSVG